MLDLFSHLTAHCASLMVLSSAWIPPFTVIPFHMCWHPSIILRCKVSNALPLTSISAPWFIVTWHWERFRFWSTISLPLIVMQAPDIYFEKNLNKMIGYFIPQPTHLQKSSFLNLFQGARKGFSAYSLPWFSQIALQQDVWSGTPTSVLSVRPSMYLGQKKQRPVGCTFYHPGM